MKRRSTSSLIRETHKATARCHLEPIGRLESRVFLDRSSAGQGVDRLGPSHVAGGSVKWRSLCGTSIQSLKVKHGAKVKEEAAFPV